MTGLKLSVATLRSAMAASSAAVLGLMVAGCATVNATAPDQSAVADNRRDLRGRVEAVFRFQNQLSSDLITYYDLSDDPAVQPSDELLAAEDRMQERCRYVNQVVTMAIDNKEPDLALKLKLMKSIDDCDAAAHEVANLFYGNAQTVVMKVNPSP